MDLLNAPGGLAPQFAMVAGAHLLALLSPGPDFLLVVRSGLLHGPRRTAAVCLGIALGNGVFILLALAAQHTPPAIQAAYGAWMFCAVFGWDLLVAYGAGHPAVASRFARSTTAVGCCTGLALWGLAAVVAVRSWRS